MSSSRVNLSECLIPLEEIRLATQNFSPEMLIGSGGFGNVYRGQLSGRWHNRTAAFKRLNPDSFQGEREFRNELEMMSTFNHENIIDFIGYCEEGNEMIVVSEYANNHSLDQHLQDPDKRRCLTWEQRLKICIRAAEGLDYLHSGLGEGRVVIHRNIKSSIICLDENLDAKVLGFGFSILINQNQPQVNSRVADTRFYLDPIYQESGVVTSKSDVYSFGIVLFEMLSGMLAYEKRSIGEGHPQNLINFVRRYYNDGLENLIDSHIRDQINLRSFNTFKEIAYQCISWKSNDRPTMNTIIKRIAEALNIQTSRVASTNAIRSHQHQKLESFQVPLKEINMATDGFNRQTRIGDGGFAMVHKGKLSERWQNRVAAFKRFHNQSKFGNDDFRTELQLSSTFHHQNIIHFIGYCDEDNEMILINEYAANASLDYHLQDRDKTRCLTWAHRLKICLGAARGLDYIHSGLGDDVKVIHRDMKSANILLDENLEAKICDFGLSLLLNRNQPEVYDRPAGTQFYLDPIYLESDIVNTESDVYSFGVVLFEMLSGMLAYTKRSIDDDQPQFLMNLIRPYYDDGLEKLIDPHISDQININSLYAFKKIAYRCISLELKDRPTMKRVIRRIEEALDIQNHGVAFTITTRSLESHLIPLKEINTATRDFNLDNRVGSGGFGVVYKGKLSERWGNCEVAIKRLHPKSLQGKKEFCNELNLLSRFHHPNIIAFIGYCDEGDQMIIVYKYAANRSLDYFIDNPDNPRVLTWTERLKICLGAAKGLDYLHSGLGKSNRVIHRDVKSGNILLDEKLEAKICDFGLSTEGPKNNKQTQIFTKVVGTSFYTDPIYSGSGILRKESDVYSFGVVLFEMLSGKLAYRLTDFVDGNPQYLINLVRYYYESGSEKLIDPKIRHKNDIRSFDTFKQIAYQCISFVSKERPTMETIIDKIEDAIDFQANPVT